MYQLFFYKEYLEGKKIIADVTLDWFPRMSKIYAWSGTCCTNKRMDMKYQLG